MEDLHAMDEQQATTLVISLVATSRAVDPALLSASTEFVGDLGFDSLDAAELLAAVHRKTGRQLPVAGLSQLQTIGQAAKALVAEGVPAAGEDVP
jgi:acyl carrier protein